MDYDFFVGFTRSNDEWKFHMIRSTYKNVDTFRFRIKTPRKQTKSQQISSNKMSSPCDRKRSSEGLNENVRPILQPEKVFPEKKNKNKNIINNTFLATLAESKQRLAGENGDYSNHTRDSIAHKFNIGPDYAYWRYGLH